MGELVRAEAEVVDVVDVISALSAPALPDSAIERLPGDVDTVPTGC